MCIRVVVNALKSQLNGVNMSKNNKLNKTEKNTITSTTTHNYKLDAECKPITKFPKNAIIGAALLALSLLIGIYCLGSGADGSLGGIFSVLLALVAIVFFILEIFVRAKLDKDTQLTLDKANQVYFEDAEVIPVFSTEIMFHSDKNEIISQNANSELKNSSAIYMNKEIGFFDVVNEFTAFAKERGCKIDTTAAKRLFASLASSRILILQQMSTEDFECLTGVISDYFGTEAHVDQVNSSYINEDSLLFAHDGENKKKGAMVTLEAAQAEREKMHFMALTDVDTSNISTYFSSFINYTKAPEASHYISLNTGKETATYYLPSNLWAIINLAGGERVASLPKSLLEISSIIDISISACDKAESFMQTQPISYSQFKLMIDQAKCSVNESEWKKLDAFTDFLNEHLTFTISNKQWIGMEKYIAVLSECKNNTADALDEAISTRVIPSAVASALRADKKIDIISGLVSAFKDNDMPISRKAVKELGKSNLRK